MDAILVVVLLLVWPLVQEWHANQSLYLAQLTKIVILNLIVHEQNVRIRKVLALNAPSFVPRFTPQFAVAKTLLMVPHVQLLPLVQT
jgi:hypothetical protein